MSFDKKSVVQMVDGKGATQHLAPPDGPPPKGPVGRWSGGIPAKQPPHYRAPPTTGVYPFNHPTEGQPSVAQQNISPQRATASADEPHNVVAPPPEETFTWHCRHHALPTISDPCLHCSNWTMPTARQFVDTIHMVEPRSVVNELLINHLHAHRDTLTAEQEAAMTTYVARHHLALPVVITAELTSLHPRLQPLHQ